ncbi:unnamed protein product [Linum tenue]|uniref:Uncharacterized protein n=1 Tax=Linum tenue TaxID=586396 RepID=A0AAV0RCK9_9ROSI|nr:unnamed protein product [Linum tenue]
MNLSRNALEGEIPDAVGPESYFMALDLSYNNLKGKLPCRCRQRRTWGTWTSAITTCAGRFPSGSHLKSSTRRRSGSMIAFAGTHSALVN